MSPLALTLPLIAQLGSGASLQPPAQVKPLGLMTGATDDVVVGCDSLAMLVGAGSSTVGVATTSWLAESGVGV